MNGITILLVSVVVLIAGYVLYGRRLAKSWGIDPKAKTPAYTMEDGVDYVPTHSGIVFGHQFASIAGAGPINGPIQAAMFGWVPVLLWILLGGLFIGAVQDFAALYASVRNKGRTIGYIIYKYIGKLPTKLFTLYFWLFSILVIAAFADIVANTFDGFTETMELSRADGQVATTSMLFIAAAVGLGFFIRKFSVSSNVNTIVAISLLIACVVGGVLFPVYFSARTWHAIVFIYIFVASTAPVWALLQPRDYLNSFLLIIMIVASVLGIVVANPKIELNAFNGFVVNGQRMFPILFVSVACGAVSGFHSLVSSGTTSKQIKSESHMLPVSFGAMLVECLLAVIALIAVGAISKGDQVASGTPAYVFASAIGSFLTSVGLPHDLSFMLINLSVSAFAMTSLDSVARVARLAFQEFFAPGGTDSNNSNPVRRFLSNKFTATIVTLLLAYLLSQLGYANIWPLFGAGNQLLSALALLACAVFLKKTQRKYRLLWGPMFVMLIVTLTSLFMTIASKARALMTASTGNVTGDLLQLIFAVLLVLLGVAITVEGLRSLFRRREAEAA